MKTVLSFFVTTLFANFALGQTNAAEVTCRAQAKEMALQSYSSCITQARNQQVEQIRSDYQKELAALKAKYDKELKGLSKQKEAKAANGVTGAGTGAAVVPATNAAPKKTAKAIKANKAVAAKPAVKPAAAAPAVAAETAPAALPAATEAVATPAAAAPTPAPVAKLPEKESATEALPIQTVQEGAKVVAVEPAAEAAPVAEKVETSSQSSETDVAPMANPATKEVEISALPQE